MGGRRLFARVARFSREGKKHGTAPNQGNGFFDRQKGVRVPSVSFLDVVKRGVRDQEEKTEKTKQEEKELIKSEREHVGVQVKPRVISLSSCDTQERIEVLRGKLIGEVKCFSFLDCIANLCLCEGFGGGVVKYLGGAWVLLDVKGDEEEEVDGRIFSPSSCLKGSDVATSEGEDVEEDEEEMSDSEEDDLAEQPDKDESEWDTDLEVEEYSGEVEEYSGETLVKNPSNQETREGENPRCLSDRDEYSIIPDTVLEEAFKAPSAGKEEKRGNIVMVDEVFEVNHSPTTPKKPKGNPTTPKNPKGNDKDAEFRSYACNKDEPQ
ncbi:hypothetical protein L2E82_36157 [Cichorium intybus]|uniref:Uncharacterized protein n=1 Tax=Cichorium intybus TaxID=13427 RepID=A0ACB9BQW6_CICIN|nr:hypothetical protein L2E82_36157 [Cichorium intybus]